MKIKEKMMEIKKKVTNWVDEYGTVIYTVGLFGLGVVIGIVGEYTFVVEDCFTGKAIRNDLKIRKGDMWEWISMPQEPNSEYGVENPWVAVMKIDDVGRLLEKRVINKS